MHLYDHPYNKNRNLVRVLFHQIGGLRLIDDKGKYLVDEDWAQNYSGNGNSKGNTKGKWVS